MSTDRRIYAYCLRQGDATPPWPAGLQGQPVFDWCHGDLSTAYGYVCHPFTPTVDDIKAHAAICDGAMARGTVLPFRFGTILNDLDALMEFMTRNEKAIREKLLALEGQVEVTIRIQEGCTETVQPLQDISGIAYLRRLGERRHHPALRDLHARLRDSAQDCRVTRTVRPPVLFKAAYLIPQSSIKKIRDVLGTHRERLRSWSVSLTGPWPPYHFAAFDNSGEVETGNFAGEVH